MKKTVAGDRQRLKEILDIIDFVGESDYLIDSAFPDNFKFWTSIVRGSDPCVSINLYFGEDDEYIECSLAVHFYNDSGGSDVQLIEHQADSIKDYLTEILIIGGVVEALLVKAKVKDEFISILERYQFDGANVDLSDFSNIFGFNADEQIIFTGDVELVDDE